MSSSYRVYVILLDEDARCPGSGSKGAVYVGETGLSREERFQKHKAGGLTASRVVMSHGVRLMPELYGHLEDFDAREEAVAAERQLRADLLAAGWRVCGGTRGMAEAFTD